MTTSNTAAGDAGATGDPAVTAEATPEVRAELDRLRASIDNIDAAVVHMLAERFKCTQQVGHLKAEHRLPPADPAREARQIERLRALAESARLDPAFAEKFLNFIIGEVIRHHESIASGTTPAPENPGPTASGTTHAPENPASAAPGTTDAPTNPGSRASHATQGDHEGPDDGSATTAR